MILQLLTITEGNDLVTLHLFMSTESQVVAPFLGCSRRSISMDDAQIQVFFS